MYYTSLYYEVVAALTLTRMIKSVVKGQAPVTLELRNTSGKKHKPKVVHANITADAIHVSTKKHIKAKSGVSLRCARSILVHTTHFFFSHTPTFQLLNKPWSQVSSLLPPFLPSIFDRA